MDGNNTISIVIPTKNEEKTIGEVINTVKSYGDEILVVDGHSTDLTREIAEEQGAKVVLDNGKGKGDGIRVAIEKVSGSIIVFIDADGSHDPQDIPKLLAPILEGNADLVMGSRMTGGSDELHGSIGEVARLLGSVIITLGINYRYGVRLTDYQNGFRAIKTSVARAIGLKEDITTIEQEMAIKCLKKGFAVTEVPTHEYKRKYGDSRINLRKVWYRYIYSWQKYMFF
ncbi:MAG: glycosyltransferase family 2 protein [Candidatus Scalinduaceae bacterium]